MNRPLKDISEELVLCHHLNGVKLIRPEAMTSPFTSLSEKSVRDLLNVDYSVYFLDVESKWLKVNIFCAESVRLGSLSYREKSVFDFIRHEDAEKVRQNDLHVLRSGITQIKDETIHIDSDGSVDHYLAIKSPLYDEKNSLLGIFGVAINVHKQSVAEILTKIKNIGLLNSQQVCQSNFKAINSNVSLTKREIEVLHHLLRNQSSKYIAKQLSISVRTVEHHVDNIKHKYKINSKSALVELILKDYQ